MTLIVTEQPYECNITIGREEDWYDPIPQIVLYEGGPPMSLAGKRFQLFIRPSFNSATSLKLLDSAAGGVGFRYEDVEAGLVAIFLPREQVIASLPIGVWKQFLLLHFTDPVYGGVRKTFWRGNITVLPGLLTSTTTTGDE